MVSKTKEILDAISNLSVVELIELTKAIEEKFGLQGLAMAPAGTVRTEASAAGTVATEKTEFSVILTSAGQNKIPVIKVVREITGLGLKEAKDLVDSAPKAIKEGINKNEAEEIKAKLTAVGATIKIE